MAFARRATQLATSCSDHELVAEVRRGSDRAFEALYRRYGTRIRTYVASLVGDQARAEDVTQEVFLAAVRRLRASQAPIAFKPWIYEIARNACIDEFRRGRRSAEVPLQPGPDGDEPASGGWSGASPSPEAAVERKQQLRDLRGAFHGLSSSQHRVLVMRELEGLSYTEIGEQLGMSTSVVESTLFRARRKLSQEYDELVSGRRCEGVQSMVSDGDPAALRRTGIRQRRQLARHLAHCQPCRRVARMAGIDDSYFETPSLRRKIAGLLPLPWLGARRGRSRSGRLRSQLSSLAARPPQALTPLLNSGGPMSGAGRMAATAVAVLAVGAGGGIVTGVWGGSHPDHASSATGASSRGGGGSAGQPRLAAGAGGGGARAGAGPGSGLAAGFPSGPGSTGRAEARLGRGRADWGRSAHPGRRVFRDRPSSRPSRARRCLLREETSLRAPAHPFSPPLG